MERCDEINRLFDAITLKSGVREWAIFKHVYKNEPEAQKHLSHFLKNAGECPPEVVTFCRKLLARREKVR